jgi:hypothetical protein
MPALATSDVYATHFAGSSCAVCAESGYQHGRIYDRNVPVTLGLSKPYINTAGCEEGNYDAQSISFLYLTT